MDKVKKILIVCTGNSCRSPMAEGFLKEYLKSYKDIEFVSAGISATEGLFPTQEAVEAMKEEGIDISGHRSSSFSEELAKSADIILAMADIHKGFILEKIPDLKERVYLFREFARLEGDNKDIRDPIGEPMAIYNEVKDQIKEAAKKIAQRLSVSLSSASSY